jgi:2-polyprenyl-6-methoxyphenol hydroxylase-like FAD-dependent oxidoreductase
VLDYLDDADDLYFDSVSQIRMENWVKERIALVGDAGYGPGAAVGGGSSLAVVGGYVLAGELAEAMDDPARGLQNYQEALRETVIASRQIALANVKYLMPSNFQIALTFTLGRLLFAAPPAIRRIMPVMPRKAVKGLRAITSLPIRDYSAR